MRKKGPYLNGKNLAPLRNWNTGIMEQWTQSEACARVPLFQHVIAKSETSSYVVNSTIATKARMIPTPSFAVTGSFRIR